jgi:predicted HAD superfamily hydrolase
MVTSESIAPRVIKFGELERRLSNLTTRPGALNGTDFGAELKSHILSECKAARAELASADVFDTLLLRNDKSEAQRYFEISSLIENALGGRCSATDLLISRFEAMDLAYRASKRVHDTTEADILDVIQCQVRSLGLPPSAAETMLQLEIQYEADNLVVNRPLLEALEALHEEGVKVILVSDMYLGGNLIADIIALLEPRAQFIDFLFSSADLKINKRSGTIFPFICAEFDVKPSRCFHTGDSLESDYRRARSAGWNAFFHPVSDLELAAREQGLQSFVRTMLQANVDITKWAKI